MRQYLASMAIAAFAGSLVPAVAGRRVDAPPTAKSAAVGRPFCASVKLSSRDQRCLAPGAGRTVWFKDCAHCPEMVVLPIGEVRLGPTMGEPGLQLNGQFRVTRSFAIGRYAVSFAEWDACVLAGGCDNYKPLDEGWGRGDMPVININWSDAQAYVRWLSRKTGRTYRLPSEAEREYATRAGTMTRYWWGDAITLEQANIDVPIPARLRPQDATDEIAKVRHRTVPVASFGPNPWGLYNVHGNVWEWTTDCLKEGSAPQLTSGNINMKPAKACSPRIARGGSWLDFADEARSAARIGFAADSRNRAQGFRIIRELP
jgi:formylglycine-generating enzyme required for sulfatase activity